MNSTESLKKKWAYSITLVLGLPIITAIVLFDELMCKVGLWEPEETDDVKFRMDVAWREEQRRAKKTH